MVATVGGFAGKVLRVDLSTGKIGTEDTVERYGDVLGGAGLGYKVLWQEVPAGTKPFETANKLVFATGVLAGTSVPCNGRTAITTIFPPCWPRPLVGSGHMGGYFAARLKYAGYDGIIIEGRADKPVWLMIRDATVEIRDAARLWGTGIRRATWEISQEMGPDCTVAAIGQAGERLAPMATVVNSVSHSAGGVGGVMGSKNLKAVAVQGSGAIRIAGDKGAWEELIAFHLSILGGNNQHVVPSFPSSQAEFHDPASRWVGQPGKAWGAAKPPVEITGDLLDRNRIAYRTNSAAYFLGEAAWKYTVRGGGCTGCPIRCHTLLNMPSLTTKYGIPATGQGTCVGLTFGPRFFKKPLGKAQSEAAIEASLVGLHLADDLGLWSNYGQMQRDLRKLYAGGYLKTRLGAKEYAAIAWDKYDTADPAFLFDLMPRIALGEGELGHVLRQGTGGIFDHWSIPETDWSEDHVTTYWKMGHAKHHANEDDGQCGVIINTQYNRDAQCHSHVNFVKNGLPLEVQKKLAETLWGSAEAVDAVGEYTPANAGKARRAKWSMVRKELHDALGICNWMGPWAASPLRERGYAGDDTLESRLYSLATGYNVDRDELDRMGERLLALHRALTIRDMGQLDMRTHHDRIPPWVFEDPAGAAPLGKGSIRMDRADIALAMDLFYDAMGWDKATGAPGRKRYAELGLDEVGASLATAGLTPKETDQTTNGRMPPAAGRG